jgi:hypothetical protein
MIDLRYICITAILDFFGQQQHLLQARDGVSDEIIDALDDFGAKEGNLSKRQNHVVYELLGARASSKDREAG